MADVANLVPPSVCAALEFLEWTRMVECPYDVGMPGRELTGDETSTRRAALALLMAYFKLADPIREEAKSRPDGACGGSAGEREPAVR